MNIIGTTTHLHEDESIEDQRICRYEVIAVLVPELMVSLSNTKDISVLA